MIHYPDLAESKGIVLMVGEYDKDVLVSPIHPTCHCHRSHFWNLNCELDPIFLIEIVFLQTRSEARGLVVQTIQYYGWAGFDDKKFGHLFRSCSVLSESLTHNVLTQVHLRN